MKKIIRVEDLCCKKCAGRAARKLEMVDGITAARGDYKKNVILVQTDAFVPDEILRETVEKAGFAVVSIEERKGLFY